MAEVVFFIASSLSALIVNVPTRPSGATSRDPWMRWLLCFLTALSISLKSSELNFATTENLLTSSWLSHSYALISFRHVRKVRAVLSMNYISSASCDVCDNIIAMDRIAALCEVEEYVAVLSDYHSAFLLMRDEFKSLKGRNPLLCRFHRTFLLSHALIFFFADVVVAYSSHC